MVDSQDELIDMKQMVHDAAVAVLRVGYDWEVHDPPAALQDLIYTIQNNPEGVFILNQLINDTTEYDIV